MKTFFVGIKGVIINEDKVLLVKANRELEGRAHWEVPGGRIDDDEAIEQALRRELKEEVTNITAVEVHEILHSHRVPKDVKDDVSLVLIFYRVTADFDGDPVLSEEHTDFKWVTLKEAEEMVMPSVATAIRNAFTGQ